MGDAGLLTLAEGPVQDFPWLYRKWEASGLLETLSKREGNEKYNLGNLQ